MYQLTLKRCLMLTLFISCILFPFNTKSQWTQQVSNSFFDLYAVHFIDENTGLIGSASPGYNLPNIIGGEIIRTTNGGSNWQRVLLDSNLRVKSFYFLDQNTGYVIGGSFVTRGYLYKTTDAGNTWQDILNSFQFPHFYNMFFGNQLTGFISSFNGVFKTTNSGVNWFSSLNINDLTTSDFSFKKIYFFDVNTGIFFSDSGKIYKTNNGGSSWDVQFVEPDIAFRDVGFINNSTGFAVGLHGKAIKTTNQGTSWQTVNFGTTNSFYNIKFVNGLVGYLTKKAGVLKTTDAGNAWFEVLQEVNDTLLSAYFLNPEVGYVAGTKGKVFKTTTGGVIGINQISTEVPGEFNLEQNYPNPFNPTTNIKFAIPKLSSVKLAVYDLLGREVESLVNQQLTPGTYEVNWNAAKFSSGIYMYRLVTNDFSMVKKISLVK